MSWTTPKTWQYKEAPGSASFNEQIRDNLAYLKSTSEEKYIYFAVPESLLIVGTSRLGRVYFDYAGTITEVQASVVTAPTGAAIICDINKGGSTIWSTQGNRITIANGANTGIQTVFNTTAVSAGDYFEVDIDQIGSTIAGGHLVIRLKITLT